MPALPHPILTCAAAQAWEAALLKDAEAEWSAMQRAGRAIAAAVCADACEIGGLPAAPRLLVLVGKGHNGGDALLAAAELAGRHPAAGIDLVFAFGPAALRPLARRAFERLQLVAGPRCREIDSSLSGDEAVRYDVCLDGLFGFHFRPPLADATVALLERVNAHPAIRLRAAIDLPSGLGESGNGSSVFRADFTYCTGIVKTPVVAPANAPFVGRVRYLDLGFFGAGPADSAAVLAAPGPGSATPARVELVGRVVPDEPAASARVLLPSLLRPLAALRPAQSDKRTFGHLLVVGGSRSYPGAVLMTVQAALRSGVGLLTACVPASLVPEYAAKFPEAMWVGFPEGEQGGLASDAVPLVLEKAARATALVLGPGLGAAAESLAAAATIVRQTEPALPLLLDADALRPELVHAALAGAARRLVLTPHAGEWARLGGGAGLREAIARTHAGEAVAVLKGCPTRLEVFSSQREIAPATLAGPAESGRATCTDYSFHGGPVLARGGSGDLLAGLIGGLLAQAPDDLWLAAARGVVWHGLAADLLARARGQVAVQTTQLLEFLQPALHCTAHEDP